MLDLEQWESLLQQHLKVQGVAIALLYLSNLNDGVTYVTCKMA